MKTSTLKLARESPTAARGTEVAAPEVAPLLATARVPPEVVPPPTRQRRWRWSTMMQKTAPPKMVCDDAMQKTAPPKMVHEADDEEHAAEDGPR